jgi:hypothetical protein
MTKENFEKANEYLKSTVLYDKTEDFSSIAKDDLVIVNEQLKAKEDELKNDLNKEINNNRK